MAFVFRDQKIHQVHTNPLGPGQYSPYAPEKPLYFSPFNSSLSRDDLFKDRLHNPGPGHYSSSNGMADQKIILVTQNKKTKMVRVEQQQSSFKSRTKRTIFKSQQKQPQQKKQIKLIDTGEQSSKMIINKTQISKGVACIKVMETIPSIPNVDRQFGYKYFQGKLTPNINPQRVFKGTPDDSVGVGNYNLLQSVNSKAGSLFGKDRSRRSQLKLMSYLSPCSYFKQRGKLQKQESAMFKSGGQRFPSQQADQYKKALLIQKYKKEKKKYFLLDDSDNTQAKAKIDAQFKILGPGEYPVNQHFSRPSKQQHFGSQLQRFNYSTETVQSDCQSKSEMSTVAKSASFLAKERPAFGIAQARFKQKRESAAVQTFVIQSKPNKSLDILKRFSKEKIIRPYFKLQKIEQEPTPGPGQYHNQSVLPSQDLAKSIFNSKVQRQAFRHKSITPAPDVYNLQRYGSFGNKAIQNHEFSAKVPFGVSEKRFQDETSASPSFDLNLRENLLKKRGGVISKERRQDRDFFLGSLKAQKLGPGSYQKGSSLKCESFNQIFKVKS